MSDGREAVASLRSDLAAVAKAIADRDDLMVKERAANWSPVAVDEWTGGRIADRFAQVAHVDAQRREVTHDVGQRVEIALDGRKDVTAPVSRAPGCWLPSQRFWRCWRP